MRITIDYLSLLDESFNSTITLDSNDDVTVLNQKLAELYGIPEKQQLLLYQRDSYTLKLIPGWPISHFCHEEEVTISLDIIGSLGCPDEFRLQLQNAHNYSMEIGSSRKVDELQRSKSGDSSTSRHSSLYFYKSDTSSEANSLTKAFSKQSDGLSILRPAAHSYTTQSKPLIQAAKNGNLEHLREYLREIKERGNSQVGPFLDECDHAGWNPLHWGIFRGQLGIVQDLVREGADVNKQTKDEWTPLQLATYRNNLEITKVLLENEHIDVNRVTARTSAIHIAVKAGNVEMIRLLEQYGADLTLENDRGLRPSDLTTDGKIHILLSDLMAKAEEQTKKTNDHQRIVKGWILKKSVRLKILNSRYFVLNFAEGTFTRYKTLADYPHHPHETIFLTDIRTIKHKKQGFLDKKRYHYIELNCTRKCTLACRTQEMADQWVLYLSQAILYNQSAAKNLKIEDRKSFYVDNKAPKWIEEIEIHDYKMHGITVIREKEAKAESQHDQEKISLNDFSVLEEVGHGGFAKVFKVMKKSTGKYYALKTMRKQELMLKRSIKYAISEANILKKMNNPFVLKLHYAFQTKQHLCLVLDYCSGGTLLFHLSEKGVFSEEEARFYIAELILAIESLHAKDIIYRDLKPDNILIDHDGHVKLADFGLAREGIKNQSVAKSICGSPAYLAPEVVQGLGACKGTDMYGIGIILFEMLVGCAPYFSTDLQEMYNNIVSKKLEIPKKLSKDARDLIQKLVDRNPSKRLGTKNKAEIKKHPFFKEIDWAKLEKKEVRPPPGYGEETFDGKDDFIGPKSIELDKDDAIMIDNINHVPNFSFVAEPREENNWIYS